MIKKIQSLLFSGQKNKEDQKKAAKANQDTIEQFIEGDNLPIDEFSKKLEKVKREFWTKSGCNLHVKVITNGSEAIIDIGERFRFEPTIDNLNFLDDIFGKNAIEIA